MRKIVVYACLLLGFIECSWAQNLQNPVVDTSQDNATKPIVLYYSRLGHAAMVATALKNQLSCDMEKIASQKDRGVFTIMAEQTFNLSDDQNAPAKGLEAYNPIIIVAPIYFMRLSAPARTLIKKHIPKGKQVYVFTTSGGPLAGFTGRSIKALVEESGLIVMGVNGFQIGEKTQSDFDSELQQFLTKTPIK